MRQVRLGNRVCDCPASTLRAIARMAGRPFPAVSWLSRLRIGPVFSIATRGMRRPCDWPGPPPVRFSREGPGALPIACDGWDHNDRVRRALPGGGRDDKLRKGVPFSDHPWAGGWRGTMAMEPVIVFMNAGTAQCCRWTGTVCGRSSGKPGFAASLGSEALFKYRSS